MASLDATQNPELTDDLQDIAIFAASLQGKPSESATRRRAALRILDEAAALFGPSAVLEHERQAQRLALGLAETSASPAPAPRTAWEHCALGRALLASGNLSRADDELEMALKLEPAGRWPNFYRGVCAYRLGRYEDAVTAFSVCIGIAPKVADYFYNRALAYAALGRSEQAMYDFERARRITATGV